MDTEEGIHSNNNGIEGMEEGVNKVIFIICILRDNLKKLFVLLIKLFLFTNSIFMNFVFSMRKTTELIILHRDYIFYFLRSTAPLH